MSGRVKCGLLANAWLRTMVAGKSPLQLTTKATGLFAVSRTSGSGSG